MAFLDNSGDIILDAVLTDTGRMRLARGDGSFRVAKFCLGDDEINYGTYNKDHLSGSAYFDLQVLQTPVLEAFTNNTSIMNSKLISIPRTSLMYLPEMVLNTTYQAVQMHTTAPSENVFLVAVDSDTETELASTATGLTPGMMFGFTLTRATGFIRIDQGLNTADISGVQPLDGDLIETQYIIEMDNRFGSLYSKEGLPARVSFIDDDNIASYYLTTNDNNYVEQLETGDIDDLPLHVIAGPRGTSLTFKIKASIELSNNNYLFSTLGNTGLAINSAGSYQYLDSVVRVTGATTGYRIDVPIRFVKTNA